MRFRSVWLKRRPPFPGETWLVYGSDDAGRTVQNSIGEFSRWLDDAAAHLHLAPHTVKQRTLHTAGDVEGHVDSSGNCYLLDLARAFPAEAPAGTEHLPFDARSCRVHCFVYSMHGHRQLALSMFLHISNNPNNPNDPYNSNNPHDPNNPYVFVSQVCVLAGSSAGVPHPPPLGDRPPPAELRWAWVCCDALVDHTVSQIFNGEFPRSNTG